MAGRTQNPGGAHPQKLGPPDPDIVRQLTTGEALACGLSRGHLIEYEGGLLWFFKPKGRAKRVLYERFENPAAAEQLQRYWEG